jgi:hypothetical protein
MADEFVFGWMAGLSDDEPKSVQIFFFEPLELAHQHIPGMDEAKQMAVTFDFDGPTGPINRALERERVTNLNVEVGRFLLCPTLLFDECDQSFVRRLIAANIDVGAEELGIDEKL